MIFYWDGKRGVSGLSVFGWSGSQTAAAVGDDDAAARNKHWHVRGGFGRHSVKGNRGYSR